MSEPATPETRPAPGARPRVVAEVLLAFSVATAAAALLYRVPNLDGYVNAVLGAVGVPRIDGWFHALVAAIFLYVPVWALRGHDLADWGLRARPVGLALGLVAVAVVVIFPPFAVGFAVWERIACAVPGLARLAPAPCSTGPLGAGAASWALRLPPDLLQLAAAEALVVALPEELFFRGYVQGRLEERWPARRRFLGAPVGAALVASAALFAFCHLAVQGNAATLAVFFPGLVFGWMRARTGSIFAGTLFHALCNLYIEVLHRSLFR